MALLSRIKDLVTFRDLPPVESRAVALAQTLPSWEVGKPTWPGANPARYVDDFYRKSGLIFRCVTVLADAVAEAPLRVYQEVNGEPQEQPSHPLRTLLRAPNPAMSESEFHVFTATLMAIAGFAAIEKQRSAAGLPAALWHLRPDWLKPIPRDGAAPDWQYKIPGHDPMIVPADDIIIITYRTDPNFGATGVSPLAEVLREAAIDAAATDFIKLIFDRGGVPPVALSATTAAGQPAPDRARVEAMREMWEQQHGGWTKWAKPPYLFNTTIEKVGFSPNDLAYPDLRALSEIRVTQAFGIPPVIVGAQAGLEHATYSNFEQAMRTLQLHTANPLRARIDGAMSRGLIPEFAGPSGMLSLEFDTDAVAALAPDEDALHARWRSDFQAGGVRINDYRRAIGLEPLGGKVGDAMLLPRGSAYIDENGEMIATASGTGNVSAITGGEVQKGTPTAGKGSGNGAKQEALPAWTIRELPANNEDELMRLYREWARAAETLEREVRADRLARELGGKRLAPEVRAKTVAANRASIGRIADTHQPALATFFREQGRRFAALAELPTDAFPRSDGETPGERAQQQLGSIDWSKERDALLAVLLALWRQAGETAFRQIAAVLGISLVFDETQQGVADWLGQVGQRAQTMTATTQKGLADTVQQAMTAGTTLTGLAAAISALFDGYVTGRAATAAQTESQVAFNTANTLGYRQSGKVAAVEFADNPDHGGYGGDDDGLTCQERDGLVTSLDEADYHFEGTHPNCIVTSMPVMVDAGSLDA